MALVLTIDGNDRTSLLVHETLTVNQTNDGLNSTCEFDLIDEDVVQFDTWTVEHSVVEGPDRITGYVTFFPDTKVEVSVVDGAMIYFAGILSRITMSHLGTRQNGEARESRILHCACHDFNAMVEESVVDEEETYGGAGALDTTIIHDIFTNYVDGIAHIAHVMDPGLYTFGEITFDDMTVRQVLDVICAQSKCVWYVDYEKELHYNLVEANTLTWWLSDNPDNVDSFEYFDEITREVDATNLVNQVFVVGGPVALWFVDAGSIAAYGEHKAIVRDTSLIDIDDIEAYGEAILERFKDPVVSYSLKTYHNENDLRAGKHIRLICALYDVDETYLINSLTITFPVDGSPEYHLTLGGLESSMSASAQRLTLDQIHDSRLPIPPSQIVLSSRGWGHDLVFTSPDHETVEWTGGDITCSDGSTFAIVAGDTDDPGAMAAKTIVYLDTDISITVLQVTTDEIAAIGANRIMIAVCWPGTPAAGAVLEVKAGFQVFGASSGGEQTFLNADNIAADCVVANHIAANTITAAQVVAHTLTGDEMGFITLSAQTKIRTAASPAARIELSLTELCGYSDAVTKQFYLDAVTGKAFAGGGDVQLDADGISLDITGAKNILQWMDGVTARAQVYAADPGDNILLYLVAGKPALAADYSSITLTADGPVGHGDGYIRLRSEYAVSSAHLAITLAGASAYVDVSMDGSGVYNLTDDRIIYEPAGFKICFVTDGFYLFRGVGVNSEHIYWHNSTGDHRLD